jgi:nitrite reductase/ring-hydroxylating ferredoxin subunit
MMEYLKACALKDVPPGKCKAVEVGGVRLVLVNMGGVIHALEDSCSHLGAPLSQGFVSKDSITCEWHGASFDLKSGSALSAPAKDPVPVFETRIVGDDIEVLV